MPAIQGQSNITPPPRLILLMLQAAAAHCQWSDPVQPSDKPNTCLEALQGSTLGMQSVWLLPEPL